MTERLTDWFVNGEKPVHLGVYNVSCRKSRQTGDWYAYWDGKSFGPFSCDLVRAKESYQEYKEKGDLPRAGNLVRSRGSWRGLAERPE